MTSPERAGALTVAVALVVVLAAGCGDSGLLGTAATAAAPTNDRLAELVEAWATRGGAPAATVIVRRAGAEVFRGAHAADTRQQFRVASITKLFVATVVMQLVEDGAVTLDDEAGVHIAGARPTVRQLLGHTSGIPDYGTEDFVQRLIDEPQHRWSEAAVLEALSEQRPAFAPGSGWEYSNSNYVALATVIEEATGAPWASVLRERGTRAARAGRHLCRRQ